MRAVCIGLGILTFSSFALCCIRRPVLVPRRFPQCQDFNLLLLLLSRRL